MLIAGIAGLCMVLNVLYVWVAGGYSPIALGFGIITSFLTASLDISFATILVTLIEMPVKARRVHMAQRKAQKLFEDTLVIGVTGSYGKTTTKEFVGHVLAGSKNIAKTPQHVNQTIPLANFILNDVHTAPEVLVAEFAAYGVGDIAYDIDYVLQPQWGILTGIAPQHIELFGSIEDIMKAKSELIARLPKGGCAFYNADDAHVVEIMSWFNHVEKVPFSATDVEKNIDLALWESTLKKAIVQYMFATNVAAACAVGEKLGIDAEHIARQLPKLTWLPHTLQPIEREIVDYIDSSYSTNPYGFERVIALVAQLDYEQKILITPGVIEQGVLSDEVNAGLSEKAKEVFDHVMVTSENMVSSWKKGNEHVVPFEADTYTSLLGDRERRTLVVIEGRVPVWVRKIMLNG